MKAKELYRKTNKFFDKISNESKKMNSIKYIERCCEISDVSSTKNVLKYSKLYPHSQMTIIENKTRKFLFSHKSKKITKKFFNATQKKENIKLMKIFYLIGQEIASGDGIVKQF